MEGLAARLARMFALALDLPEEFFADRIDRHVSTMRLNFYPAQPLPPLPGQIRAGAHSDYGAFTILRTEAAPGGLQVVRRGGTWIDVPNIQSGFVVNIGDLLMRWTNDRWVSTIHRVINPPEAVRANTTRMSIAFFEVPNHDVEVRCFDSCTGSGNPPRYAPTTPVRIGAPRFLPRGASGREFRPSARWWRLVEKSPCVKRTWQSKEV